jgi:hypothetical protein
MENSKEGFIPISQIKGPFYPCPISEQETIVSVSRDEESATIYTNDLTMLTKCKRAAKAEGSQWRLIHIDYMGKDHLPCGWTFTCPKRLVSFRTKSLAKAGEDGEEEAASDSAQG